MAISIKTPSLIELLALQEQFARVYDAVYSLPPYNEPEENAIDFSFSLPVLSNLEGFRCKIAWNSTASALVGFAIGYSSQPDFSWHTKVATALDSKQRKEWLGDAFEWVEFAVTPAFQRQGIGNRLQYQLLNKLLHKTALLQAHSECDSAMNFYRKHGWSQLCECPENSEYLILGKRLH